MDHDEPTKHDDKGQGDNIRAYDNAVSVERQDDQRLLTSTSEDLPAADGSAGSVCTTITTHMDLL